MADVLIAQPAGPAGATLVGSSGRQWTAATSFCSGSTCRRPSTGTELTELAADTNSKIDVAEFRMLNLCLDNAIAGAVTEFLRQREQSISEHEAERLGSLAHEQRNLISAAMLSLQVLRGGTVPIGGSTAAVLGRALMGLRDLTDGSLAEVRLKMGLHTRTRVPLAEFIEDVEASASMEAKASGIRLTVASRRGPASR